MDHFYLSKLTKLRGDHGRFYVPEELLSFYRDRLVPLAIVLTPNQFEAEQLVDMSITRITDVVEVCRKLHDLGPQYVVITSLELASEPGYIFTVSSTKTDARPFYTLTRVKKSPHKFSGTGDLMACLIFRLLYLNNHDLGKAMVEVNQVMAEVVALSGSMDGDVYVVPFLRVTKRLNEFAPEMEFDQGVGHYSIVESTEEEVGEDEDVDEEEDLVFEDEDQVYNHEQAFLETSAFFSVIEDASEGEDEDVHVKEEVVLLEEAVLPEEEDVPVEEEVEEIPEQASTPVQDISAFFNVEGETIEVESVYSD